MATMSSSDFFATLNVTGTPTAGVNTVPKFPDVAIQYYLREDLEVSAASNQREFDWQPYNLIGIMMKVKDFAGDIKFVDNAGIAAATADAPVDPETAADSVGNQTTGWFYVIQNARTKEMKYWVHQSQLLDKASAKTYWSNEIAQL